MKRYLTLAMALMVAVAMSAKPDKNFHIYLCFGQSNMEGNARIEEVDRQGVDPRFMMMAAAEGKERHLGQWYPAIPPLCRENNGLTPVDYFGRTLVENLPQKVRVGVINVAIGGCKIEAFMQEKVADYAKTAPIWMKGMLEAYNNDPYQRLLDMARLAQKDGVIKGILIHQGESNTGEKDWPEKVKIVYERLLKDLGLKAKKCPLLVGEVVNADTGGVCASMNEIIQTVPQTIPTAHVISSAGCPDGPDNLHFSAEGYRMLGKRYAEAMLKVLK